MTTENVSRLEVQSLKKTYNSPHGAVEVIKNVSFSIRQGETVALIGSSGSGKTTLLALCAGIENATSGSVTIDGEEVGLLDEARVAELRNTKLGFIFQNYQLIPSLTALENVMIPAELGGRFGLEAGAGELLAKVGLSHRRDHYPSELSGGEQQRVAIARSFMNAPALILADEPTGNLDGTTRDKIADVLFEMNRIHNTSLLIATHDLNLAKRADRILVIDGGVLRNESLNHHSNDRQP